MPDGALMKKILIFTTFAATVAALVAAAIDFETT